jgi:RimJ/RimL family protein N-acetyltransferase
MIIRPLEPTEAEAYAVLRREMLLDSPWAFSGTPENDIGLDTQRMRDQLAGTNYAVIGAFDDTGKLAAACGVSARPQRKMAHRVHIWGVYVTPSCRGRGIGKAVVQAALDIARTWPGINSASLSASVRATTAIALYQTLGFVIWGTEPECISLNGTLIDEVHLTLRFSGRGASP